MTRKYVLLATILFLALTGTVSYMGYRSKIEIEAVATDQFNRQQLILAEKIAQDIGEHFDFLGACLRGLALFWRGEIPAGERPWRDITPYFEIIRHWNVLAMGFAPHGATAPTLFGLGGETGEVAGLCDADCLALAESPDMAGRMRLGRTFVPDQGPYAGRRIMLMSMSVPRQGSDAVDGAAPAGVILFVVDPLAVARRYAHDITSGQTGYAWVVDDTGIFLDHFEERFIGQESIGVRRQRNPGLDWSRITWLLNERVLKGERGVDWYVSGWHRGLIAEIKKLVAFCPVRLPGGEDPGNFWAVALTAPESEVQGVIGRLMLREWLVFGLFEIVVVVGFLFALSFSVRWSHALSREVARKRDELLGAQEELLRSARFAAVGQAAAHLSHEIKNPLTVIGGFAHQVRKSLPEDGREAEKLRVIEDEARRLEAMLGEVRDFSRPTPPRLDAMDLNATVEDALRLLSDDLAGRKIETAMDLDPSLPVARHDAARIRQVLINLVKNAAEAMVEGGRLSISTRHVGPRVHLRVADNGPGIPEEVAATLFDPFTTTKETGTGLGLAVCRRIVEDHKGLIRFTSQPGQGAAFIIELPAEESEPVPA